MVIALLAVVLRVGFAVATSSYEHPVLKDDGIIAYNLVSGRGFSEAFYGPERPTASQSPFHPFLIATVFRLFGVDAAAFFVLMLLRALAVAAICVLVERIARRLWSRRVALASALATAVMPTLIYFCSAAKHLDSRTLYSTLGLVATLHSMYRFQERPTAIRAVACGVTAAVASYIETVMLMVLPFLWLWMVRGKRRLVEGRRIRAGLLTPLVAAALLAPWCIRNEVVFARFVPIKSSFGTLLWVGNNPDAEGQFDPGDDEGRTIATSFAWPNLQAIRQVTWFAFPARETLPPDIDRAIDDMSEPDRDRVLSGEAMRFIEGHPSQFLELCLKRFWVFVASPAQINADPDSTLAHLYPYQRALNIALLPLAVAALVHFRRRNLSPILIVFCGWTAVYSLVHSTYYYYRIPLEPLLFTVVIALLAEGRRTWRARNRASRNRVVAAVRPLAPARPR